ncbi:MAG TPA: hypothetical protein PLV33_05810 [Opitutaceae bacterium]|nr:hypothetical protein [Opitutaceae bacterium]HOR24582.1 hypothetical protein [Opitutaceae bacterium]HPK49408.1 hypothetical protein [Opitutaceae bacterium]
MRTLLALICLAALPLRAAEQATFESGGALTAMIRDGVELPVRAQLIATFEGGVEATLQPHDQKSTIAREGIEKRWSGATTFSNGRDAHFSAEWAEDAAGTQIASVKVSNTGEWPLLVQSIDYVIDLPRDTFVGGRVESPGIALPEQKPADATFYRGEAQALRFVDKSGNWMLSVSWAQSRAVTLTDRWDADGRSYRLRVRLWTGPLATEEVAERVSLRLDGHAHAVPAALSVDVASPGYAFEGFGANYCWATETPITPFMLDELKIAWSRHELKAILWDLQRDKLSPMLTSDFERIARIQKQGTPWIISLWRLPERFYVDPNQRPMGTFGRQIAGERWPEFLDLIGSYLLHLKTHYGAEPDLFSFNEPDLGVSIGLTPEGEREAIKRIGAHLRKLGLKTKMLLGDTANPRDSHKYVLATAADAEAMQYVGAISFHSWWSGTPAQYQAWAEVAAWLNLPLIVGEAGTDPGSYRNRTYDSYAYGLKEAWQTQDLLRYARPAASLYWQFTDDYALARVGADGVVQPTGRFWLMKHFNNLTPQKSRVIDSASDRADVAISAFAKGDELVVHVLNTGAVRTATLAGLPAGDWRRVTTTEEAGFQETEIKLTGAAAALDLPARSLTTLVRLSAAKKP